MSQTFEERIAELNQRIKDSQRIVFFSGAGVSTESGIPDFRSKDGLYNQKDVRFENYRPEYLLSKNCLQNEPNVFFEFYRQKLDCRGIEPNVTHRKMAELERAGKDVCVVTQNIDGLHQKAGSEKVCEIHGTTERNYCEDCHAEYGANFIFESSTDIPVCPECGGAVRPDVTLYGEGLPHEAWVDAMQAIHKADLVVVCGTSLTVYPAASMLDFIPYSKIVIVNRDETKYDRRAALVFHESLGEVFSQIEVE